MSKKTVNSNKPQRPNGIYLISLWAILRASIPVLALMGRFTIEETVNTLSTGGTIYGNANFDTKSFIAWLLKPNAITYFTLILSIAFLVTSVGLLVGKRWSRLGFLTLSIIMVFWNLRAIAWGRYSLPLYSLVALGIAHWYLRQPRVVQFFNTKANVPDFLQRKILNIPLELAISLGLLAVLGILEVFALLTRSYPSITYP